MSKLREIRFLRGMNQYQLAILAQMHQSRISLIENGYVKPRADEKERLAKALNMKPDELWPDKEIG